MQPTWSHEVIAMTSQMPSWRNISLWRHLIKIDLKWRLHKNGVYLQCSTSEIKKGMFVHEITENAYFTSQQVREKSRFPSVDFGYNRDVMESRDASREWILRRLAQAVFAVVDFLEKSDVRRLSKLSLVLIFFIHRPSARLHYCYCLRPRDIGAESYWVSASAR